VPALVIEHTAGCIAITLAQRGVDLFHFHIVVTRPRLRPAKPSDRLEHGSTGLTLPLVVLELRQVGLRKLAQPLHHLVGALIIVICDGRLWPGHFSSSSSFRLMNARPQR